MNLSRARIAAPSAALCLLLLPAGATPNDTSATYSVRFDATWSAATHPGAYPAGAHFSPMIGATHDASVTFWEPGGISSPGMEVMAETGAQFPLGTEINTAITAGQALERILDNITLASPGVRTPRAFTVTEDHPLVTLVTMVAPSPDWFVGVHGLSLLQNGTWVDDLVVELHAYDAGTDSGPAFTSPNQNTNPQDPIQLITGGPFFGTVSLGTFTFRRLESTLAYGCGVNPAGSLSVTSGTPSIGTTLSIELSDPTGTMITPAATFLALTPNRAAGFPCGTLIPNWGMTAVGAAGEFLVQNPLFVRIGAPYSGTGVGFDLAIPNDPTIVSRDFYMQGLLIDPTKRRGLTNALEIRIGE